MNIFGNGLLLGSGILLLLIGCGELRTAKISFSKEAAPPGNSKEGLPRQVATAATSCHGYVTIRFIYNLAGPDFSLASCQELQFVNGSYTPKQSLNCSGGITSSDGAIFISTLEHNCNGFLNLAQGGKLSLRCSGEIYDRTEGDYAFRSSSSVGVNGVNIVAHLCQKQSAVSNRSPTIADPGSPISKEGDSVNFKISASDPDGNALTFSSVGLPTGLSINSSSGAVTGTIAQGAAKAWPVTIIVTDEKSNPARTSFVWTVTENNPNGQMAFVTSLKSTESGAKLTLSGPVQGLRYGFDNSSGWVNLSGPFESEYTITKTWTQGTTYACAQALGTDGVWRGTSASEMQTCNAITAAAPTTKTATVTWNAVTQNLDGSVCTDLAGYIMYYSDINGDWGRFPSKIVNAPSTSGQISGLISGKTYYFTVAAFDTSKLESPKSQVLSYTIP